MSASIERVEVFPLRYDLPEDGWYGSAKGIVTARSATLVRVVTSDGVEGWGESFGPPRVAAAMVRELAPSFVGEPVGRIAPLSARLVTQQYHLSASGIHPSALSGIDMALWDAWGRTLGSPLWQLLGGDVRREVPAYASTGYATVDGGEDLFRASLQAACDEGFDAVKIKLGFGPSIDERRAHLAREVIGPDRSLMVDYNANYPPELALASLARISHLGLAWVEEPIPVDDISGWRWLRARTDAVLSTGESLGGPRAFRDLLAERLVDVVQPDLTICGGLTAGRSVAVLAQAAGVRLFPHVWGSAVGDAAALQLLATLPDATFGRSVPERPWFERDRAVNPLRDDLLVTPLDIVGGVARIPDGPGLGVDIDTDRLNRYLLKG